jgi:hypothetical protein
MFSLLLGMTLAVSSGPMGPDAPAHEPQLAVNGSTVVLAFGAGQAIYFTTSSDGGKTFSAPIKVGEAKISHSRAIVARESHFRVKRS